MLFVLLKKTSSKLEMVVTPLVRVVAVCHTRQRSSSLDHVQQSRHALSAVAIREYAACLLQPILSPCRTLWKELLSALPVSFALGFPHIPTHAKRNAFYVLRVSSTKAQHIFHCSEWPCWILCVQKINVLMCVMDIFSSSWVLETFALSAFVFPPCPSSRNRHCYAGFKPCHQMFYMCLLKCGLVKTAVMSVLYFLMYYLLFLYCWVYM